MRKNKVPFNLNQWLRDNPGEPCGSRIVVRRFRLLCNDGFHISVQASAVHHCYPRGNTGPYESVELGFASRRDRGVRKIADGYKYTVNPGNLEQETICSGAPVAKVESMVRRHGGIAPTVWRGAKEDGWDHD